MSEPQGEIPEPLVSEPAFLPETVSAEGPAPAPVTVAEGDVPDAVSETERQQSPARDHERTHHHSPHHHAQSHEKQPYNLHTHHHVPHRELHDEEASQATENEIFQDRESEGEHGHYHGESPHRSPHHRSPYSSPYSCERRYSSAGPSEALLRTTAARIYEREAWGAHLEEKRVLSSPMPIKKPDPNYVPGERLLKTTQSRIHERRQWEEIVKNKQYEDDIWWEKRRPAPVVQHKKKVASRLNEPTVAALHGKRDKFQLKKETERSRIESPPRDRYANVAPIDVHSPLLRSTTACLRTQVDKEGNLLHPPEDVRHEPVMPSKLSGPQVSSKLMQHTRSYESAKWVEKKPEEKTLSPRLLATLKPPSARLLEFNTAMKAQSRDKATKKEADKREQGWNYYHHKDKIPEELPPFTPTLRWSGSGSGSPRRSHSLENGHMFDGAQNEEMYYDDNDYEGEDRGGQMEGDEELYYDEDGNMMDEDGEYVPLDDDEALPEDEQLLHRQEEEELALQQEQEHAQASEQANNEQINESNEAETEQETEQETAQAADDSAGSNVDSEAPAVEQDLQVVEAALEETTIEDKQLNNDSSENAVNTSEQ